MPLIRLECFPVERSLVEARVEVDGMPREFQDVVASTGPEPSSPAVLEPEPYDGPTVSVPLVAIAHGRSGDKGADVNIGIRARHADFYPILIRELTTERVADHLAHLGAKSVSRFELPGIDAVNFLLESGLGSGGSASLRFDPQGKAVAQQLLDIEIEVPVAMQDHEARRPLPRW
jgi:hypothetical protein